MKLVHIICHFEFSEAIERILDGHEINNYIRLPMMEGKDIEGKHFGSQAFPGNVTAVQAQVEDDKVDTLLDQLKQYRQSKEVRQHLQAFVLPIERYL